MRTSILTRFEKGNDISFKSRILDLHLMKKRKKDFMREMNCLKNFCETYNLGTKARLWYYVWADKVCSEKSRLHNFMKETTFHPAMKKFTIVYLTKSPNIGTLEHYFSTLRRV